MVRREIAKGEAMASKTSFVPVQTQLVPYPEVPLEGLYVIKHDFWRGLQSKHTRDLVVILVLVLFAIVLITATITRNPNITTPIFWGSQIVAAMFTTFLAVFATIYQFMKQRFSTVDVFSSEILARLRILAVDNSVEKIIEAGVQKNTKKVDCEHGTQYAASYFQPSQENHFEIFHRRSSDLGALAAVVVDHVTDFYSFQMATRDVMRDLADTIEHDPTNVEELRVRTIDTVFMIDLMAYSGLRALEELIETPAHRLHSRQVALSVATRANAYLLESMPDTDFRYPELRHRSRKYRELTSELRSAIKPRLLRSGMIPRGKDYF